MVLESLHSPSAKIIHGIQRRWCECILGLLGQNFTEKRKKIRPEHINLYWLIGRESAHRHLLAEFKKIHRSFTKTTTTTTLFDKYKFPDSVLSSSSIQSSAPLAMNIDYTENPPPCVSLLRSGLVNWLHLAHLYIQQAIPFLGRTKGDEECQSMRRKGAAAAALASIFAHHPVTNTREDEIDRHRERGRQRKGILYQEGMKKMLDGIHTLIQT